MATYLGNLETTPTLPYKVAPGGGSGLDPQQLAKQGKNLLIFEVMVLVEEHLGIEKTYKKNLRRLILLPTITTH